MTKKMTLADRWRGTRNAWLLATVVASTFMVTYVATVRIKPLFSPDSSFYAAMALWFGGTSKEEAVRQVIEMRHRQGWSTPQLTIDRMFGWGLVQPRVVLPALSAPFVKIWGIEGLAVVPGLAMAALIGVLTWLLVRRWGWMAGVATVVLIMCSWRVMFYGSAMLTDSLSALWGALILVAAWHYQRQRGWRPVVWMVVLTVISGFTRQATLVPAGAFVTAWLVAVMLRRRPNGWGVPALAVTVTSVAVQLLQNRLFPTFSQFDQVNQFKANTGASSLVGAMLGAPALAWRIAIHDLGNFAGSDHPLLVLVLLSGLSMVIFWRRAESHLLLGAILGIALYNVATGSPTAFRYAMPGLAFFAVSVALLFSRVDPRPDRPPEAEFQATQAYEVVGDRAEAGGSGDQGRQLTVHMQTDTGTAQPELDADAARVAGERTRYPAGAADEVPVAPGG